MSDNSKKALMKRGAESFVPGVTKLLSLPAVACLTGMSRSSIYVWMDKGTFPKPLKVGSRRRWLASDVEAWVDSHTKHGVAA